MGDSHQSANFGDYTDEDYNNIIDQLDIFNDMGCFPQISIVESDANFSIYFVPENQVTKYIPNYPGGYDWYDYYWSNDYFQMTSFTGAIVTDQISPDGKKYGILGILGQGIGFLDFSYKYSDSIFYNDWTNIQEYSEMDYAIMRILYSEEITAGMDVETARAALMP